MTRDEIIELAREAELWIAGMPVYQEQLERFAALVEQRNTQDARRYRYLKSFCSPMGLDANNNHLWTCRINPSRMRGASVDEALDAAMERDGWRPAGRAATKATP
jgi:hypothetical protein